jgi:hypothetical protein
MIRRKGMVIIMFVINNNLLFANGQLATIKFVCNTFHISFNDQVAGSYTKFEIEAPKNVPAEDVSSKMADLARLIVTYGEVIEEDDLISLVKRVC